MIFITGATSFVGRNLLERLERENIKSICLIRSEEDKEKFVELRCPKFVVGNLFSNNVLRKSIKRGDIVLHLANMTNSLDKNIYYINIEGTRNLIEICENKKIKRFIYISSANILYSKKDRYDKSKFIAEKILKASKLKYSILRPSVLYGKYDYKNIYLIIKNLKNKRVKVCFKGSRNISPVFIGDLITVIIRELNSIGNKQLLIMSPPIDKKRFYEIIFGSLGMNTKVICLPSFIEDIYKTINKLPKEEKIDLENYKGEIISKELTSFEEGLKKIYD